MVREQTSFAATDYRALAVVSMAAAPLIARCPDPASDDRSGWCPIQVVLSLDLVQGGDLLFELRVSFVYALDYDQESPRSIREEEDTNEHH